MNIRLCQLVRQHHLLPLHDAKPDASMPAALCTELNAVCNLDKRSMGADVYFICALNSFVHVCMYVLPGLWSMLPQPVQSAA